MFMQKYNIYILFISILSIISNSIYAEYTQTAKWKKNAFIQVNSPSPGATCVIGGERRVLSSAKDIIETSTRKGNTLNFSGIKIKKSCLKKSKDNFKVRVIFMQKRSLSWLKEYYDNAIKYDWEVGASSFNELIAGFDKNNINQCFISWLSGREPKYYVGIAPCKK